MDDREQQQKAGFRLAMMRPARNVGDIVAKPMATERLVR
jgi:hypothetical protein